MGQQQRDDFEVMMAGWCADGRRGSSSAASWARRRALVACGVLVDGAARCRLDGRGRGKVSGSACRRALMAGSEHGVQRRSELSARVPCLERREEERGERKRAEREKERPTV